jgi:hypothetical protein
MYQANPFNHGDASILEHNLRVEHGFRAGPLGTLQTMFALPSRSSRSASSLRCWWPPEIGACEPAVPSRRAMSSLCHLESAEVNNSSGVSGIATRLPRFRCASIATDPNDTISVRRLPAANQRQASAL